MDRPNIDSLAIRELLRLSQTDVTPDPLEGLAYAAQAYEMSVLTTDDPTAAGEAAAKAGFRAEQAQLPVQEVDDWFAKSHKQLRSEDERYTTTHDERFRRERVATHILQGRSLALRLLVRGELCNEDTALYTSVIFGLGNMILESRQKKLTSFDPYGTMLDKHWATHEAMNGSAIRGAKIAVRGLTRAIRAKQETANAESSFAKHAKFVVKQSIGNLMAGALSITKPLDVVKPFQKLRRKVAISVLG